MDAKKNCDRIELDLKACEDSIKSMFGDVQILKDGRYHQAQELARRCDYLTVTHILIASMTVVLVLNYF